MFSVHEITAFGNGLWGASGAAACLLAHFALATRGERLTRAAKAMCRGVRVSGACVALHRLWWNVGIWMRPEDGSYWHVATDHRWVPTLLILGVCYGTMRAIAPYTRTMFHGHWTMLAAAYLIGSGVLAAVLA